MKETENKVKQQIVDKIKSSTNILVTVSRDPSVDELSAALGLTALLNKLDKHATAIFSGAIPDAISFLDPSKVFENTTDSLRDFIIALDKEKADHLRYKVEGDVVKIFITPYRTTITDKDLQFSQGDFNVELVLALGVESKDHLDEALAAHGQVLDDATVATFSAGSQASQLGTMDWRDENASSLCEMIASISDLLKTDDKSILDKQTSTALLTGIVAATDRFSNVHTTSQVMTIAAQLMAAGADQQLIAAKLQECHEIDSLPISAITEKPAEPKPASPDGSLTVSHDDEPAEESVEEVETPKIPTVQEILASTAEAEADDQPVVEPIEGSTASERVIEPISGPAPIPEPTIEEPAEPVVESVTPTIEASTLPPEEAEEPLLGGILNATSDQAAEDARRQLDEMQNRTILDHSYVGGSAADQPAAINSAIKTDTVAESNVDIFANVPTAPSTAPVTPTDTSLPMPPPLPDFSTLPPPSALPDLDAPNADSTFSTLPPAAPKEDNDPSQFKIPG